MKHRFFTCDVFTSQRFRGNQLAVLPEADGLTDEQMQQIAREFNFSETTFVFPPRSGHTREVRIFTPATEVPFAGHPNIGTAFVLASTGALGPLDFPATVTFEEKAGLVPITIEETEEGEIRCELSAPEPLSVGDTADPSLVAPALSLEEDDILVERHPPRAASVGLPFLMIELATRDALERAAVDRRELEARRDRLPSPDLHLYVRSDDEFDLRARMFAPLDGVPEDPGTGSANCALAGLLAHLDGSPDGSYVWRIAQGVEMGRPCILEARSEKRGGAVTGTWIGGLSTMVSEGFIHVG